ncbi:hypothetical protein LEP1GSC166_3216 [Leptospira kirschneri]|nr:hypothetical protein LEP1GSC166_3216 [Leptospira kirschneri]
MRPGSNNTTSIIRFNTTQTVEGFVFQQLYSMFSRNADPPLF